MPYIMEKRGRGDEKQTVPDYYLQPSVPQEFVSLSVLHNAERQAGLKVARKIFAGWRETNIIICIIIFNNQLEKGH